MSKLIFVRARTELSPDTVAKLRRICARLAPDGLSAQPPAIHFNRTIAYAVLNPTDAMLVSGDSVLLGSMFGETDGWSTPGTTSPDGSYALIRSDERLVEAVCDPAGSRTLWTFMNDEMFVCATSQRAILMLVGGFAFDERVLPWILSTGTPGPTLSWDRRIEKLAPDSTLTLDCRSWRTRLLSHAIRFAELEQSAQRHRADLMSAIEDTFGAPWSYRPDNLTVPLSGGYDSRTILCLLHRSRGNSNGLESITWGVESNRAVPGTDGKVALELAQALGVPNRFIALDDTPVDPQVVLDRFIRHSEGRIDHVAGYVDAMNLWQRLHETGVHLILRGDEGFGWVPGTTERAVRYGLGLATARDYANLDALLHRFGIAANELPTEYQRGAKESLPTWRDRLYHAYRIPTILAALSDIKFSYLDLISPLLSRRILQSVRTLPDVLRTNKVLFKEIADSVSPKIPYATASALGSLGEILSRPEYQRLFIDALRETDGPGSPIPNGMLTEIASGMRARAGRAAIGRAEAPLADVAASDLRAQSDPRRQAEEYRSQHLGLSGLHPVFHAEIDYRGWPRRTPAGRLRRIKGNL